MKKFELLAATALAMTFAQPALAQTLAQTGTAPPPAARADDLPAAGEVVVTAQRRAESLQSVPIAVTAFTAEALERQQIDNASDLQLTLPNVTFTKGNFTSSSFTIRGIGDLCVGVSCDSATAIHINGTPLAATRLFETEYFDLERVEVLRGPQGTLFGRNATSGVVNFISAKPNLNRFMAAGEAEYGNFDSIRTKGMINVPLTETLGVRVAGFYLNRDGYTKNLYDGSRLDGRDMYALRGSVRWQPTSNTTIDLMAYYFRENDNRLRYQKQECQRDPTGVLGCLAGRRTTGITNANSQFTGVLTSAEFLRARGIPAAFALGSIYGTDAYATAINPADPRQVVTDSPSTYFADEQQYQARIEHDFGSVKAQLTGFYHKSRVDSSQDYNLSVANRAVIQPGINTLAAAAAGAIPGLPAGYFQPIAAALIPNGPAGVLCTSNPVPSGTGAFGGAKTCGTTPLDFDRSNQSSHDWSAEGIVSSDFDGAFNFLLGGIYADARLTENSYYVNGFPIDYLAGVLGSFTALGNPPAQGGPLPPAYLGSPYFRNNTDQLNVRSYGVFGEAYVDLSDTLKLTGGLRYNNDRKYVRARSTLASFLVPYAATDIYNSPYVGSFDADPGLAGNQLFQVRRVKYDKMTGRAVLDWKFAPGKLLYASYSRGYKSGGVNPPLQPVFAVPESFAPETVDAFEIGTKNTFMNGTLRLNATGFYYRYKNLQLSRIVARTAVNDNVDADIYGFEAEAVISPVRAAAINLGFSLLKTKVREDKLLANPRDFGGGRADAVIIKDITNGANCAVAPVTPGNAAGANGFVAAVNNAINAGAFAAQGLRPGAGLRAPTAFPADGGINSTGAFSVCAVLAGAAASPAFAAFGPQQVLAAGVETNIRGNELPQAPRLKFSAGAQYTFELGGTSSLVPRADIAYTGESWGSIFNRGPATRINRIQGYTQVNAQLQFNGGGDRFYVRGFVQNVFNSNATTGLAVGDQSSGLFTNIFTLEPRRYGVAAGFRF